MGKEKWFELSKLLAMKGGQFFCIVKIILGFPYPSDLMQVHLLMLHSISQ